MSSAPQPFPEARREHHSILAGAEKRFLVAIAHRLPAWVNSDHLTCLGFLALIAAGGLYWYSRWNLTALWLVILCLVINWFGDSLDGTLARVPNRQRPRYGFYVDHIIDAFSTFALVGGMALSGHMTPIP